MHDVALCKNLLTELLKLLESMQLFSFFTFFYKWMYWYFSPCTHSKNFSLCTHSKNHMVILSSYGIYPDPIFTQYTLEKACELLRRPHMNSNLTNCQNRDFNLSLFWCDSKKLSYYRSLTSAHRNWTNIVLCVHILVTFTAGNNFVCIHV